MGGERNLEPFYSNNLWPQSSAKRGTQRHQQIRLSKSRRNSGNRSSERYIAYLIPSVTSSVHKSKLLGYCSQKKSKTSYQQQAQTENIIISSDLECLYVWQFLSSNLTMQTLSVPVNSASELISGDLEATRQPWIRLSTHMSSPASSLFSPQFFSSCQPGRWSWESGF